MKIKNSFSLENTLLSLSGHLLLGAMMVTSLYVVLEQSKLVAPDRVEILEIDLTAVQITRDTTELFNTDAPDAKPETPVQPAAMPQPAPAADPDKPIETPAMLDPLDTPEKPTDKKPDPAKAEPAPQTDAPKSVTVVRVNRETTGLRRTMTVSVIDALRVAMTRCWVIDQGRADIADLRVVAHLTMHDNGMVRDLWFESGARADTDPAFAYVVETIRTAVGACQPFKMLPKSEFDAWQEIQFTFYPGTKTVQ